MPILSTIKKKDIYIYFPWASSLCCSRLSINIYSTLFLE